MSKAPIWAVTAPGARRPSLSREKIAEAAMNIADFEGFEALSMRRVAEVLDVGTMTLYHYVRTKDDLLTLVEDALMGETGRACDPLPDVWQPAIITLALATRATYLRHPWALRATTGARVGPNAMWHIELSLRAVASLPVCLDHKLQILAIVDDYVFGHCASVVRTRSQQQFDRKTRKALNAAMTSHLDDFPLLRAVVGDGDPVDVLVRSSGAASEDAHFELGLGVLLDGLARHFKLK